MCLDRVRPGRFRRPRAHAAAARPPRHGSDHVGPCATVSPPAGAFPKGIDIDFGDGSGIRIDGGSTVKLDSCKFTPSGPKMSFKLVLGTIWANIKHGLGGDDVGVVADTAVIGNRGTYFRVHIERNHAVTLHLLRGKVVIGNRKGRVHALVLRNGSDRVRRHRPFAAAAAEARERDAAEGLIVGRCLEGRGRMAHCLAPPCGCRVLFALPRGASASGDGASKGAGRETLAARQT